MAVRIKLKKRKTLKIYDVIVSSKGTSRGNTLEVLGYYKPEGNWSFIKVNLPRLLYWVDCGAKCSDRVLKLLGKKVQINK